MKLHDLRPAAGSRTERTRVGRGIAAGKGKTAGRGTKGQKARAGGSIPAWFEGGQTPIHMRVPKLRGFKNRFKVEFEVVNVGRIAEFAERGRFAGHEHDAPTRKGKAAPITVNAARLREAGLIGSARTPLKVLGAGEVGLALFVVADAFTRSAREKLEAAGGTAQLIEVPERPGQAIKGDPTATSEGRTAAEAASEGPAETVPEAPAETVPEAPAETVPEAPAETAPEAPTRPAASRAGKTRGAARGSTDTTLPTGEAELTGSEVAAAAAEAAGTTSEPETATAAVIPSPGEATESSAPTEATDTAEASEPSKTSDPTAPPEGTDTVDDDAARETPKPRSRRRTATPDEAE